MAKAHSIAGHGQGWHKQSGRHSNARRTGRAGGTYATHISMKHYDSASILAKEAEKNRKLEQKERIKEVKKGAKPLMEWMEDIDDEDLKFRIEEAKENGETLTKEEAEKQIYEDTDYWDMQFENLTNYLSETMEKKQKGLANSGYWHAEVKNFGWRGTSGQKVFQAKDGKELLQKTLPDTDNHFKIFNDGKRGFKIQNYHHDSPMGNEWYYIRPATIKEIQEQRGY